MASRPRRLLLLIRRTLVGLGLVLVSLGFAVQTDLFSRQAARLLENLVAELTGERVLIGGVRINVLKRRASVEGVVVSHVSQDPAQDGATIAAVERIVVVLGLRDGAPNLKLLEIDRPSVHLHLDAGGLREFQKLQAGAPADPDAAPADQFPWERLRIVDAALTLDTRGGTLELEGLDLQPEHGQSTMSLGLERVAVRMGEIAQEAHGVSSPGLVLTPSHVKIPVLNIAFRPERVRVVPGLSGDPDATGGVVDRPPGWAEPPSLSVRGALEADLAGALVGDLHVDGQLSGWNAALPDSVAMDGALSADVTLRGTVAAPTLSGGLRLPDGRVWNRFDSGHTFIYELGDLAVAWRLDDRVVVLEPFTDQWADGAVELRGTVDLTSLALQCSVTGESLSLARALQVLGANSHPWVDFNADLEAQMAGTLDPLQLAGSFELVMIDLGVNAGPMDDPGADPILRIPAVSLDGELRVNDRNFRILAHRIASASSSGSAAATIGYSADGPLDVVFDLEPMDLALLRPLYDIDLMGKGRVSGRLWGPYSDLYAAGEVDVADFEVLAIPFADHLVTPITSDLRTLDLPQLSAHKGASRYTGSVGMSFLSPFSMDIQLLLNDTTVEDVAGMFLEIPGLTGHMEGTISLEGDPLYFNGEADLALKDVDLFGEPFETGFAIGYMDQGRFTLDDLVLTRFDGAESVLARGTVKEGWASHFEIVTGGLRLERMGLIPDTVPVRGLANLDAEIGGTLFEPEPRGRVALRDTWLFGQPVQDSTLNFSTAAGVTSFDGQLAGPGLAVLGTLGLWGEQLYEVHARLDSFPISVLYPVAADGGLVDATISGIVDLSGAFGDDPTPVDISADLAEVRASWGDHELRSPAPWRYTQHGRSFQVENFALTGGDTDLVFGGWRAEDGRTVLAGGGSMELDLLRVVVPDLTRAEGVASLQLSAVGSPGRPLVPVLDASITDATFRGDWFPHPFEGVTASFTGTPNGYEVLDMQGILGGGTFTVTGGVAASGWVPTRYDLSAVIYDARVQYLDYLPPFEGDATLSFDGPASQLMLSGDVAIKSMVFSDRLDWETWVLELANSRLTSTASEETGDYFALDLTLKADDTLRVRNNVGDLTGGADLRVVGDTSRVGMVGTVRMDPGGRVYLKEREFELQRGEIHFDEPFAFDPDLDIALSTTVASREQDYNIDLRVSGPYSDWRTDADSDPMLPQADINALLLFGMTQDELERYGGLTAALALEGGDLLASRFGLVEKVGEGIFQFDLFKLDRVDLVSGVSERGSGLVSSEIRLLAEKDLGWDTRLVLEQNLLDASDTYIALDKQLAKTLYARIYWASQQYGRSLAIGGAYGLDVNLRWEFN